MAQNNLGPREYIRPSQATQENKSQHWTLTCSISLLPTAAPPPPAFLSLLCFLCGKQRTPDSPNLQSWAQAPLCSIFLVHTDQIVASVSNLCKISKEMGGLEGVILGWVMGSAG